MLVANFPILNKISYFTGENNVSSSECAIVVYAGGLTGVRGIKKIIDALEFVQRKVELWLIGKWGSVEFAESCQSSSGWKHVKYFGYVLLPEVYQYLRKANIGIVTLLPEENYLRALPTKAFEYMACGLPLVMSDFPYWREIFGECAVFADPENPRDIAKKIKYLIDNPHIAKELGQKGRYLVETKYNWENESKKLITLYKGITLN
ncbi:MAG: glycosyltransferase [Candidatus Theseobacter exili]|nr:glycosyltransferase [Candidatus Theseobacter exili]